MLWIEKANRMRQLQQEALANIAERVRLHEELSKDDAFISWAEQQGDSDLLLLDDMVGDVGEPLLSSKHLEKAQSLFTPAKYIEDCDNPLHPMKSTLQNS